MEARVTITPRPVEVSGYYSHRHPEAFLVDWRAFYREADARTLALRRLYPYEANVLYGAHPYQILDLYHPRGARSGCPVLIFLHGGGFREGHPAHYGFLARPFLDRSVIFISAGYRLIPECYFPESTQDVGEAIAWVYYNIGQRGGDPNRSSSPVTLPARCSPPACPSAPPGSGLSLSPPTSSRARCL